MPHLNKGKIQNLLSELSKSGKNRKNGANLSWNHRKIDLKLCKLAPILERGQIDAKKVEPTEQGATTTLSGDENKANFEDFKNFTLKTQRNSTQSNSKQTSVEVRHITHLETTTTPSYQFQTKQRAEIWHRRSLDQNY